MKASRVLSLLLAVIMVFSLIPSMAFAAEPAEEETAAFDAAPEALPPEDETADPDAASETPSSEAPEAFSVPVPDQIQASGNSYTLDLTTGSFEITVYGGANETTNRDTVRRLLNTLGAPHSNPLNWCNIDVDGNGREDIMYDVMSDYGEFALLVPNNLYNNYVVTLSAERKAALDSAGELYFDQVTILVDEEPLHLLTIEFESPYYGQERTDCPIPEIEFGGVAWADVEPWTDYQGRSFSTFGGRYTYKFEMDIHPSGGYVFASDLQLDFHDTRYNADQFYTMTQSANADGSIHVIMELSTWDVYDNDRYIRVPTLTLEASARLPFDGQYREDSTASVYFNPVNTEGDLPVFDPLDWYHKWSATDYKGGWRELPTALYSDSFDTIEAGMLLYTWEDVELPLFDNGGWYRFGGNLQVEFTGLTEEEAQNIRYCIEYPYEYEGRDEADMQKVRVYIIYRVPGAQHVDEVNITFDDFKPIDNPSASDGYVLDDGSRLLPNFEILGNSPCTLEEDEIYWDGFSEDGEGLHYAQGTYYANLGLNVAPGYYVDENTVINLIGRNGQPATVGRYTGPRDYVYYSVSYYCQDYEELYFEQDAWDAEAYEEGETVEVRVIARGVGLTYQWYYKDPGDSAFKKSSYKTDTYSTVLTNAKKGRQVYCVVKDSRGNTITSRTATLYARWWLEIITQPQDAWVAKIGDTATITVEAAGDGLTYDWYIKDPGDADFRKSAIHKATYSTKVTETSNGRQLFCRVWNMFEESIDTQIVTMGVKAPLKITTQPSNQTVAVGATATFKVVASGTGLKYQWQYKTSSTASWKNSSSATTGYNTATLKVVGTTERNGFQYRCKVTDGNGNYVFSNAVTLTVSSGPKITTQPTNQTVAEGATATFKVVASGTGLKYQWQFKTSSTASWKNSSSATTGYNTATLKVVGTAERNGFQYRCKVTDGNGNYVFSNAATLTVTTGPKITTQPGNQTVAEGATATFKVVASGTGLKYQWQFKTSATASWKNSSSATTGYNTATLKVVGTTERNGFQYRCKVTDSNGNYVFSNAATLTVSSGPQITRQPVNAYVKAIGDTAKITVKAEGEGLTYTWYYKNPGASTFTKSAITKSTYSTTVTSTSNGRQLYCVVKDKNGNEVKSDTVTMSKATSLAIITQPEDVSAANGAAVSVAIEAYGTGLTYQWYFKDAGSSSFSKSSIKTNTYTTTMNADRNGRQIYCVVKDSASHTVNTITVTLTMK